MVHIYLYIDPEKNKRDHEWQHNMGQRVLSWAGELPENSSLEHTSVSHSGGYVAVALADAPVGVDIECKREISLRVADRALGERERQYLREKGDDPMTFLQLWTLKESYGKSRHVGIAYHLRSVEFLPVGERTCGEWEYISCLEEGVSCRSLLTEEYALSVCVQKPSEVDFTLKDTSFVTKLRRDVT